MTDHVNALLVVLDYDVRDDDPSLLALMEAIKQMRNVTGVTANITTADSVVAEMRIKAELLTELTITLKRTLR